jgi:hypothetical protein
MKEDETMDLSKKPDGQYFVDTPQEDFIQPVDSWPSLSLNQLLETKTKLIDRAYQFRNNPTIVKTLGDSLRRLEALISERLSQR